MGIYKHLEGQVKWRFQHFLLFFLMDGDSLGVVHWELSEWNRKGEIWKKTKEKTRKKHTKTKKMSEHVGKNAFHMSHKPICFSIDHLWRVLLHEGEALIVSQKKRTPKGCLVRGQLAQMTLCYIFGRSREYENSSGVSIQLICSLPCSFSGHASQCHFAVCCPTPPRVPHVQACVNELRQTVPTVGRILVP